MKKITIAAVLVFLMQAFDRYTKTMAVFYLKDQEPIPLIKDVFEFRYLENQGAAFGSLQGKQMFLLIITGIVLSGLIFIYMKIPFRKRYYPLSFTIILLFSGAVGNMIDRISQGYVIDFLYFKLIDFPIFNVADCYVTIAAFLLIILILFVYEEDELQFIK